MSFVLTEEQQQFRDVLRHFLDDQFSTGDVRRLMATEPGFDDDFWTRLNRDLGLAGIIVPEAYGGQGFGFSELGIVMEEMGRSLVCAPYLSSAVMAADAVATFGGEVDREALLPRFADGSLRGCVAIQEAVGSESGNNRTMATPDGDGVRLDGIKDLVIDGHTADLLLVVAGTTDGGSGLYQVSGTAPGLDRRVLNTLDPTRKLARVTLASVPAVPLGVPGEIDDELQALLDRATVALSHEMVGGAEKMLYSAVEYGSTRRQFGRLIGSFQAIKHKCADLLLEIELAKSAAYRAAVAIDEHEPEAGLTASIAKCTASEAYMHAAAECIQIHGGIGFTWDHDTHLWYKRAKASEVMFGDARSHRERALSLWSEAI